MELRPYKQKETKEIDIFIKKLKIPLIKNLKRCTIKLAEKFFLKKQKTEVRTNEQHSRKISK